MPESTAAAPPHPPAGSRVRFVLRIVGGCVVVAVVVGIGLVARELTGGDELDLPDRVDGLPAADSDAGLEGLDPDRRSAIRDDLETGYEYNNEEYSSAYDGAEAATRIYRDPDMDRRITVVAVRENAGPPLPVQFDDPELSGATAPRTELVEEGDVICLLGRGNPTDDEPVSILCHRTGGDLTVQVLATSEPELDDVVDATEEVWDELS